MRILGFINAFDELADKDRRLGRKVANYGLAAALLEYSSCDELHFFLPFYSALKPFEQDYGPFLHKAERSKRVKLLPAITLPASAERFNYLAIHAAELDRYFPELCHLRNALAPHPFPVTCTPHTLSYWSTQVRNIYKVLPGVREYDSVFCTSRAAQSYLEACFLNSSARLKQLGLLEAGYAGRLDLCPLGIKADDFGRENKLKARQHLKIPDDVFTMLCLGRLTASDKFDLMPLLGILWLLAQKRPVQLILAGAEQHGYGRTIQQEAVRLGLGDKVHILANFDSKLKPVILAAADVLVSPVDNLQETFGLSLLEAMASGLPVVASDFSGYRDLVVEGGTGFLIPTFMAADLTSLDLGWPLWAEHVAALQVAQRTAVDVGLMLKRLETLADNPETAAAMGRAGRQRVKEVYDWPVVVKRMEGIWLELKNMADRLGRQAPEVNVPLSGLGAVFGKFPTDVLYDHDELRAGPLAQPFMQGQWAVSPHQDLGGAFNAQQVFAVLTRLQLLGGQAALADLCLAAQADVKLPLYMLNHLCLWAMKYGLLTKIIAAA